ncbi:uncharacterized protein LOC112568786 [Pomacea canaliculata]|uniref:uncharacterized protein LOC112568786 n=1 Tax=Pomacea canaliculata TaxID=400727 RepID=UPI000D72A76B|nr:uncharacterized protein LOC112568786 [Pomacea canaliculata]
MKASGMEYLGGLLLLVLAFTVTVSGTQARCEERESSAVGVCFSQHAMAFSPLLHNSYCDRKLITEQLCTKFVFIVECVNEIRTSPSCSRASLLGSQMNFACNLTDLQEECADVPELDTDNILTMASSSGSGSTMTEVSSGDDMLTMEPCKSGWVNDEIEALTSS